MGLDYSQKPAGYFNGVRMSFVESLPHNPEGRLLEIGCGSGATAAYAAEAGKCGWCCGVELCPGPAEEARKKLQQVIVGNVEQIELDFPENSFDVVLLSEVLEHLADPWAVLRRLFKLMKPGALVFAGSPNVCHRHVIWTLLCGDWPLDSKGVFDATHLRWFSPASYRRMFENCGFVVTKIGPANPLRTKARWFNMLTGKRFEYLLHSQIHLQALRPS
jgi:2-polyprenyl-3-methyl-5-hydroxy-6-metoxy-1,4-benzoquinol methylase